jgi:hypothetical protein
MKVTKKLVSYGTAVPYARAVQYGKGRIAKRRFVGWSPEMKAQAVELMSRFMQERVEAATAKMQPQETI